MAPKEGTLILIKMEAIGKGTIQGKLTTNMKGLYIIVEEVRPRAFRLVASKGNDVQRISHSNNLMNRGDQNMVN